MRVWCWFEYACVAAAVVLLSIEKTDEDKKEVKGKMQLVCVFYTGHLATWLLDFAMSSLFVPAHDRFLGFVCAPTGVQQGS